MPMNIKALRQLNDAPPWDWADGTAPALLEVLRNPAASEPELALAVELAGNSVVIDDELVIALLAVVRSADAPEQTRGQAALSFGPILELAQTDGFDDADSVPISERTFHEIQRELRALYLDAKTPKLVRRRILEASVRAPEAWHAGAISAAYASGDEEWQLTSVFAMRYVGGFDEQIVSSLSTTSPQIHAEAIWAAGAWSIDAAWQHVVDLVSSERTDESLLLPAIVAVGEIRPTEAPEVLAHLEDSEDPDIALAVLEATSMTGEWSGGDDEVDDLDEETPA